MCQKSTCLYGRLKRIPKKFSCQLLSEHLFAVKNDFEQESEMKDMNPPHSPKDAPGTLYWLTGLSRVGKTTVSQALYQRILSVIKNVVFLDGDNLREVFGEQDDYTREGRMQLAGKMCGCCAVASGKRNGAERF